MGELGSTQCSQMLPGVATKPVGGGGGGSLITTEQLLPAGQPVIWFGELNNVTEAVTVMSSKVAAGVAAARVKVVVSTPLALVVPLVGLTLAGMPLVGSVTTLKLTVLPLTAAPFVLTVAVMVEVTALTVEGVSEVGLALMVSELGVVLLLVVNVQALTTQVVEELMALPASSLAVVAIVTLYWMVGSCKPAAG